MKGKVFAIIMIFSSLILISSGVGMILLNDTDKNDDKGAATEKDNSSKKDDSSINDEIISAVEEKIVVNVKNDLYKSNKIDGEYKATVDKDSIKYTSDYSSSGKYYVMEVSVYNKNTNLFVSKYYARCQWKNGQISNYGDTVKISTLLDAVSAALGGTFSIVPSQYKNDSIWDASEITDSDIKNVLQGLDTIDYYYYKVYSSKDEGIFEDDRSQQISALQKIVKCKTVNFYNAQFASEDELGKTLELADYLNYDLFMGKDDQVSKTKSYFQGADIYKEEVVNIS